MDGAEEQGQAASCSNDHSVVRRRDTAHRLGEARSVATTLSTGSTMSHSLSPAQRDAFDRVIGSLATTNVAGISAVPGFGRTTVLRALHDVLGGTFLGARDFLEASRDRHPFTLEEMLHTIVTRALATTDTVIVDDLHIIATSTAMTQVAPRGQYLVAVMASLSAFAEAAGKTIIFGVEGTTRRNLLARIDVGVIGDFKVEDFAHVCGAYLPAGVHGRLDFARIHRFASKVNAYQLRRTAESLAGEGAALDTERFITHLGEHHLASNVRLGEVQDVDLADLRGMDDMLQALEAGIIFPLEHADLSDTLKLRPKRGVLIAGPPGTGKTSVGRALARRLRGKFFLLDGTVISGHRDFFERVQRIFQLAKQNAPAIIFIDDSDVIFEANNETGFYRYLLTMLDGLETESAGQVCVMVTAMDVGNLPPALVRSGRIELWLETRLPDALARAQILADRCTELPSSVGTVDIERLTEMTEGMSGADLRRMVEDGKLLYAYDLGRGAETQPITEYVVKAMETVRSNKERYAQAEARARSQMRPPRPASFFVPSDGGPREVARH
jgi:AAA+ superfamily predicted ATPase